MKRQRLYEPFALQTNAIAKSCKNRTEHPMMIDNDDDDADDDNDNYTDKENE